MMQRTFTTDDQLAFARLSGDQNPLHMDPLVARRLIFGKQVVHGMHALLWSLDQYFDSETPVLQLVKVKGSFQTGIGVGEEVNCHFETVDDTRVEIRLTVNRITAVWAQVTWASCGQHRPSALPADISKKSVCRDRSVDELIKATGTLPLYLDRKLSRRLFPNLTRILPAKQLSELLATTRLVGMECPGLHSIFSGLEMTYHTDVADDSEIAYQTVTCNPKLSLLLMKINSTGMDGKIKAFIRPGTHDQAAFSEAADRVTPDEFADQTAVVVGGSRGLGEVTAKLLAAGGADVFITFYKGEADARRIAAEIVSNGAKASFQQLNVLNPPIDLLPEITGASKPVHLYYFATPFIFGNPKGKFSNRRFNMFCDYYVGGFLNTLETLVTRKCGLEKTFYPSTTAIDEMPLDMAEYAAAKAAGENLCDFLEKTHPSIQIYKPRLPRLATDQTVSLLPVENQDPLLYLLSHLRKLRDL